MLSLKRYEKRPEVLHITAKKIVDRRRQTETIVYECAHMDNLLKEIMNGNEERASSIVHWDGGDVPIDVVSLFDFVILDSIPSRFCDKGGIFRPWKQHEGLPTSFRGKSHGTTFFAGFEKRTFEPLKAPSFSSTHPTMEFDSNTPLKKSYIPVSHCEIPLIMGEETHTASGTWSLDDTEMNYLSSPLSSPKYSPLPSSSDNLFDLTGTIWPEIDRPYSLAPSYDKRSNPEFYATEDSDYDMYLLMYNEESSLQGLTWDALVGHEGYLDGTAMDLKINHRRS